MKNNLVELIGNFIKLTNIPVRPMFSKAFVILTGNPFCLGTK